MKCRQLPTGKTVPLPAVGLVFSLVLSWMCLGCATQAGSTVATEEKPASSPSTPGPSDKKAASTAAVTHVVGHINVPGGPVLEYQAVLRPKQDGTWEGNLDIPAQGLKAAPLSDVVVNDVTISFRFAAVGAGWTGAINDKGKISCSFSQQGAQLPCEMARVSAEDAAKTSKVRRPQTPEPPFPYDSTEVKYRNEEAGVVLGGTLTVPRDEGPHTAVLLVSGSGPQDRDETVFDHKPFLILADHLSRRGIAVLRVDDRGVGDSTGDPGEATSRDFADDVRAGLRFLATDGRIDSRRIGLIGHSEGATIATMVAAQERNVAFVVMLAGTGVRGADVLVEQLGAILGADGAERAAVDEARRQQRAVVNVVLTTPENGEAREKLQALLKGGPAEGASVDRQIDTVLSPWFRHFLAFDPATVLTKVRCPVLVLHGAKDLQVSAEQNGPAIKRALRRNRRATVRRLPDLNHLFQHAKSGSPREYAAIEETMAPEVLEIIRTWIAEQTTGA